MGRPGAGRMVPAAGALDCAAGGTIRGGGALYTGRGPVCGTIIRGAGGCGGPVITGGTGREAGACVCGADDAVTGGAAEGGGAMTATGGATGRGGVATGGATATGVAGFSTTGGATTCTGGAGGDTGGVTGAAGGGVGLTVGGAITGRATTGGGATGRIGGATASFCCVMAFRTSPGREMCDKSILVLISSSPRSGRADLAVVVDASDEPRR